MKKVINILGSAKFAFIVTILIVLLSFIGTIFSDRSIDNLKYNFIISRFFNPETDRFLNFATTLGLLDIYTSPLFILLLVLFNISLIICTIRLFPFAKKGFPFINKNNLEFEKNTSYDIEYYIDFFNRAGWRIKRSDEDNNIIMAEQHKAGKYGVIITHIGLFIIMISAAFGYIYGFNGSIALFEKETVNGLTDKKGEFIPFGFDVTLNSFNIEFYEGTKTAKAFLSDVTISKDNKELHKAIINTNHPLKYNNIVFYQSYYNHQVNQNMKMSILFFSSNKQETALLEFDKPYKIGKYTFVIKNFYEDFGYDIVTGKPSNMSSNLNNPAVLIKTYDENGKFIIGGWLLLYAHEPTFIRQLNMALQFKELDGTIYSGISVKYNPAISFIYLGGILMCFGVLFIYLLNYTAVVFTVNNGILQYSIFSQRKLSLTAPAKVFHDFLNKEK